MLNRIVGTVWSEHAYVLKRIGHIYQYCWLSINTNHQTHFLYIKNSKFKSISKQLIHLGIRRIPILKSPDVQMFTLRPRCYMCRLRIDPSGTFAERPRLCACCEALNGQKRQQAESLRFLELLGIFGYFWGWKLDSTALWWTDLG